MATIKGSGTKAAPAKKSSGSKSPAAKSANNSAAPAKKATAAKKSTAAPAKAAPAKKATAQKSSAPASRAGSGSKSAAPSKSTGRSGGTATKSAASQSSGRGASAASSSRNSGASARKASAARTDGRPLSANDLEKAFKDLLKDIFYAEKKLRTALGKMAKAATHADLKEAFTVHQSQTDGQIEKLEEVFGMLGMKAQGKRCAAMDGLLEEADEHIEEYEKGPGLDAAMIVGAQKVEHYEMAAYGSLRNFAKVMGQDEAADAFEEILQQETDTDELLTGLSDTLNRIAYGSHVEEGGEAATEADSDNSRSKSGRGNNASERSSKSSASSQADSDMEDDTEGDSNNRGGGRGSSKAATTRDEGGDTDAEAGSDDTGGGRTGSSADASDDSDADTASNR